MGYLSARERSDQVILDSPNERVVLCLHAQVPAKVRASNLLERMLRASMGALSCCLVRSNMDFSHARNRGVLGESRIKRMLPGLGFMARKNSNNPHCRVMALTSLYSVEYLKNLHADLALMTLLYLYIYLQQRLIAAPPWSSRHKQ